MSDQKPRMKALPVLHKFFGKKEGQTLMEFNDEIKQLSDQEKIELARLAAEQLGVELDDADA